MARHHTSTPDYTDVLNISSTLHPYHFSTVAPTQQTFSFKDIQSCYPFMFTGMILSVICSIASLMVFITLPQFRNIHGRCLITLSSCLLIAYFLLCLDFFIRPHISYPFCYAIAVVVHFCFMGFYLWNTILAFDTWRTMVRIQDETYAEDEPYSRRYIYYSIFAWTATLVSTAPAFVLELTEYVVPKNRPKFGEQWCWLSGLDALTFYFNTPVGFIVVLNSILYILAIRKTHEVDQLIAFLQTKKAEKWLNKYLRLFYLMGLVWFVDFLPWMTRKYWTYVLASLLFSLYGVIMFFIFVMNRGVTPKIREVFFGIPIPEPQPAPPINENQRTNYLFQRRYTEEDGF